MGKSNYNFKKLHPFKWFILQNYPFLEDSIDVLTNYELFCKLGEMINNQVAPINEMGEQVETLTNAFNSLYNWFENLDVQDEVDNKLDEMAESGELTEIIAQYLTLAGLLCYNTKNDMKSSENLSNGSFVKTFGTTTYNDGKGQFYKIRSLINTDVIDDVNLIALTNYPALVAELMPDEYKTKIDNLEDDFEDLTSDCCIIMGDSYGAFTDSWIDKLITKIGTKATCYKVALGGLGFAHQSSVGSYTFLTYLQSQVNNITNHDKVKKILVCGGYNDTNEAFDDIKSAIVTFCNYCGTTFPNAQVYIGMVGFNKEKSLAGAQMRQALAEKTLTAYSFNYDIEHAPVFVENSNLVLHNEDYIGDDNVHPNSAGSTALCEAMYQWYLNGHIHVNLRKEEITLANTSNKLYMTRSNNNIRIWSEDELYFSFSTAITINSGWRTSGNRAVLCDFTNKHLFPSITGEGLVETKVTIASNGTSYRDIPALVGLTYDGKLVVFTHTIENNQFVNYPNVSAVRIEFPINMTLTTTYC